MTNYDFEKLILDLANRREEQERIEEERSSLRNDLKVAEQLVAQLRSKKNMLDTDANTARREIIDIQRETEKLQRLQAAEENRKALQAAYLVKSKELDTLTATAHWREFAFDHQISGGKRLAVAKRGICADKRGLGKTLTSLIWGDMSTAKRVLVLAPNDVVPQFEDEIRLWAPGRTIFSLRGLPKGQRDMIYPILNLVKEFIITLNYEAWRKDKSIIDDLVSAGIDTIICDEAHRIKSSNKITARGVFQIAYRPNYCRNCNSVKNFRGPWENGGSPKDYYYGECDSCSASLESTVKNVLCMTGTPILNKPQELFSLLFLVDRLRFPNERTFLSDYCYSSGPNRWRFLTGGLSRLTESMSEFFIQRNREDAGIHIPPPAITIHELEKDIINYPKQYKAERDLQNAAALVLENGETHNMLYLLEVILRERQVMTWPAGISFRDPETREILCSFDVEESQKIDAVEDLLKELIEEEERVIVFSQFKGPLYELAKRFSSSPRTTMATGDQSSWHREQVRTDFDLKTAPEDPRWNICLATYKAFGQGINLNAARHVILLDDEWNPGMEDQAIGRIDRMNSTDQANVHIFRVKNSIDNFMAALLKEKSEILEGFESSISASEIMSALKGEF